MAKPGSENVKVAVRVRPFNERETHLGAKCCVSMLKTSTLLHNPEDPPGTEPRRFTYDYSYWSHDGYKEREDGYFQATSSKYADQQTIFNDLGKQILENAWIGYNCSIFAYGQTGSGKSYSIVGYGANKGIVPLSCEELFHGVTKKRQEADTSKEQEFEVTLSMVEIYNEKVRDLLVRNSKPGLKIREGPKRGFFVQGLTTKTVMNYEDINNRINEGTRNRTIAATNMNATSSRAHTIVAINLIQKGLNDAGQNMTKTSTLNLVDLAGSERVDKTGAVGDRLQEGININQSLSTLGNVIKALADSVAGKRSARPPYRDSVLTMLLKNALSGNSKTIMIASISPADNNYEETLSTLRYADRAKSLKTKAIINESPTDKLIRELKEENERLQKQLAEGKVVYVNEPSGPQGIPEGEVEEMKKALQEELLRNKNQMSDMEKSYQQRLQEAAQANDEQIRKLKEEQEKQDQLKVTPHFWNLNEDPALTGMVIHFARAGKSKVGNKKASPPPDILLVGLSINRDHAVVSNKNGMVTLEPRKEARILVNGKSLQEKVELHHNDRVMFGPNHLYVFHHPQDFAKNQKEGKVEVKVTYDKAQAEIAENSGFSMDKGDSKSKEDLLLQEDLIEIMPMVTEANAMGEELGKETQFEIALVSPQALGQQHGHTQVKVMMKNLKNGNEFMWDRNKFLNRKYLMQEMYQKFAEGDQNWDLKQEEDPFWEPCDTNVLIGIAQVILNSLTYMIELEETVGITDFRGHEQGHLRVELFPCSPDGSPLEDDPFVEEPKELIQKKVYFNLKVPFARGIPSRYSKCLCQYKFYLEDKYKATVEVGGTSNPEFGYNQVFQRIVTQQFLEYLELTPLTIEVWGKQQDKAKNKALTLKTPEQMNGKLKGSNISLRSNSSLWERDEKYKLEVELSTHKKRLARIEEKMKRIQSLVDKAKESKEDKLDANEVDKILKGVGMGSLNRFKAVVKVAAAIERAKRGNPQGKVTSATCSLQ